MNLFLFNLIIILFFRKWIRYFSVFSDCHGSINLPNCFLSLLLAAPYFLYLLCLLSPQISTKSISKPATVRLIILEIRVCRRPSGSRKCNLPRSKHQASRVILAEFTASVGPLQVDEKKRQWVTHEQADTNRYTKIDTTWLVDALCILTNSSHQYTHHSSKESPIAAVAVSPSLLIKTRTHFSAPPLLY